MLDIDIGGDNWHKPLLTLVATVGINHYWYWWRQLALTTIDTGSDSCR